MAAIAYAHGAALPPPPAALARSGEVSGSGSAELAETGECRSCRALAQDMAAAHADLDRATNQLARAHQLLRAIRRLEAKPGRVEGFEDDAAANLAAAQAEVLARIRTRIELYLASAWEAEA